MTRSAPRRTVLAAALATAAAAAVVDPALASAEPRPATGAPTARAAATDPAQDAPVDYHAWTSYADWRFGAGRGTFVVPGLRPGIVIGAPLGTTSYTDPHTGTTAEWEYAQWTSPLRVVPHPATELVSSWNAQTPQGTWIQVEMGGTYNDGTATPWFVMGRWTSGDSDADIRRTSVDGQDDGRSGISTDTFAIDDESSTLRLSSYRLRVTLYRAVGSKATPTVFRVGAMASDIPARFTVPASTPGEAAGIELPVPTFSQDIHVGQYPQYDGGGEAWCSPTSSSMVVKYWGRGPTTAELAWVDPSYQDPEVDYAARYTYDYQYEGCGNWPFNAAYAASWHDMESAVTRLHSLNDIEHLIAHGIPVITSQSFLASELDGSNYSTSGHLMCIAGFTADGDVVAHDPASSDDAAVRNVYKRAQFETVWLRTKRYNATGGLSSGSGGVVYVYWPTNATVAQRLALAEVGIR
jgi:Peptidase_C39 like family